MLARAGIPNSISGDISRLISFQFHFVSPEDRLVGASGLQRVQLISSGSAWGSRSFGFASSFRRNASTFLFFFGLAHLPRRKNNFVAVHYAKAVTVKNTA